MCYYGKPQCKYSWHWAAAPLYPRGCSGGAFLSLHFLPTTWQLIWPQNTHIHLHTHYTLIKWYLLLFFWSQVVCRLLHFPSSRFPLVSYRSLTFFHPLSLSTPTSSSSFPSFFENMTRIKSPGYVPTETDVLRVRLRTTGVIETQFKVNHLIFR